MFRILRVHDLVLEADRRTVRRVQRILREQFSAVPESDIEKLPEQLADPLSHRFRTILFVADDGRGHIKGFAILLHVPNLGFCFLDFISTAPHAMGRGIGGALYERLREEARSLGAVGLFFETLPDDPALCRNAALLKGNAARLRFYARYGARPIAGTEYELPLKPEDDCPPHLVFDGLGDDRPLPRARTRRIVRAILERKYGDVCPPGYIDRVVGSFRDDPVRLHAPQAAPAGASPSDRAAAAALGAIVLTVNDRHQIHHVRERGYVESPVRVDRILRELDRTGLFETPSIRHFGDEHVKAVHDAGFVEYLRRICASLEEKESVYPYVFPIRNPARPPLDLPTRAGYYCIDTFTPLNRNAWPAARRAVDCVLTAADRVAHGSRLAYALVRPPGHHAERRAFGGFCYLNSTAVAAHFLSRLGKVAVLDVDYHHGNGTQEIFWRRSDVLTVSIHGHPRFAYPYFSGFADEKGEGDGLGFSLNLPLPEEITPRKYDETLAEALRRIARFGPRFLVVALGLDTARGDPTGSWPLRGPDFFRMGRAIGGLGPPTLVVQEGGYRTRSLGAMARQFFLGLWEGAHRPAAPAETANRGGASSGG
jgi:acetoin utilization deacetylase AcuC-like enzyme/GNAT superfamily N-acetyltransferase